MVHSAARSPLGGPGGSGCAATASVGLKFEAATATNESPESSAAALVVFVGGVDDDSRCCFE